jgi:ATP-binding cassette subfamily C protein CydD
LHQNLIGWVKKSPINFVLSILFLGIGAISLIFQLNFIAKFVNGIIFQKQRVDQLTEILFLISALIICRGISNFIGELFSKKGALQIKSQIRKQLLDNIVQMNTTKNLHSGNVVTYFYDRVEAIEDYFSLYLPQVVLSIIIPIIILIFIFPFDLLSGVVFLITAPLIPFFMILIGKFSNKETQRQWKTLSQLSIFFLDSIRGIKTLLLFNQEEKHLERIKKANQDYVNKTMSVLRITFLSALVLEILSTLSIAVVAVEIGLRLLYYRISFEQAFFILLVAPEFYLPLRNLGLRFHAAINGVEAYKEIYSFFSTKPIIRRPGSFVNNPIIIGKIEIENLKFKYPETDNYIFDNFSFMFETGKRYAIVGPNGSGKTTLFHVLLRFLQPENGRILIDRLSINDFTQKDLFSLIAWLPQNPVVFKGSILDNLKIANPSYSDNQIIKICEKVNLLDYIQSLPDNIHTEIQEHGVTISSGERQKIGLARMLMRAHSLVLCDEPTSTLDPITERLVVEILNSNYEEKITLTIAHKLQTIKQADVVLFFQKENPIIYGHYETLREENSNFRKFIEVFYREKIL